MSPDVPAVSPAMPPSAARTPEQLLASVEALVHRRIHEMAPHLTPTEREDAAQCARREAWLAAQRYDTAYGTRFTTYAGSYITGGIAAYLRGETRQTKVAEQIRRAGTGYLAEEPDDFDILLDTDEQLAGRLDAIVNRQVTAMLFGMGTAPADPESTVAEERDRRLAAELVERGVAAARPEQRAIVDIWYRQGRPIRDVAAATGRSERSLRRDHEELLDRLHAKLAAAGITELPEEK